MDEEKRPPRRLSNAFFTYNNPTVTLQLYADLIKPKAKYFKIQLERGAEGTPHIQGVIKFTSQVSFNRAKNILGTTVHLEPVQDWPKAMEYCGKEDTRVEGPIEYGERPMQGKRSDLEEVAGKILTGSTGHQPLGFDEMMIMYGNFVVIGSKISLYYRMQDDVPCHVGIRISQDTTQQNDAKAIMENGEGVYVEVQPHNTATSTGMIKLGGSTKRILGIPSPLSEISCQGDIANNPASQWHFDTWCAPWDPSVNSAGVLCYCQIDYVVVFITPKFQVRS